LSWFSWWSSALVFVLVACGSGPSDRTTSSSDPDRIEGVNQTLPSAVVGERYEARVTASGGVGALAFEVGDGSALPLGLDLAPDGRITGVPAEAGTALTQILASDELGQTQRFLATIDVALVPELLRCGEGIAGAFTASAIRTTGPVWEAVTTDNLQWLGIPWPQDDNTEIEIVVDAATTVGVLVQRPNQPEGSLDWREDYVSTWVGADSGTVVTLHPGTLPSLSAYETQGIVPVLVVAFGPGDYRLDVRCSDGPVFRQTLPLPVRLGDDFAIDYEVYGDNSDVTYTIEGDLPEWVTVDEVEGTLSGTAIEEVTVDLTITAATGDGRTRTIDSIFGVYDPKPITCGETVELTREQSYYDGAVVGYYDPRGYEVFALDVPASASAVQWTLDGLDGQFLGLVDHDEDRLFFYGGADRDFATTEPALVEVTPRTYPATRHYRQAGTMYMVAAPTASGRDLTLTATCDDGPRPDLAGLPVVQPLFDTDEPLPVIGGTPPWQVSAAGLPPGLSVVDGRLVGNTAAVGVHDVDVAVTDDDGASFTEPYELTVGLDVACDGGQRVECGDVVEGSFSGTFFEDTSTQSEARLCFVADGVSAVGFELSSDGGEFRVDIGDPGVVGSTFLGDPDAYTYGGVVFDDDTEAIALNPFSWPALPDYDGLPIHVGLRAVEPGDWRVAVVCETPSR